MSSLGRNRVLWTQTYLRWTERQWTCSVLSQMSPRFSCFWGKQTWGIDWKFEEIHVAIKVMSFSRKEVIISAEQYQTSFCLTSYTKSVCAWPVCSPDLFKLQQLVPSVSEWLKRKLKEHSGKHDYIQSLYLSELVALNYLFFHKKKLIWWVKIQCLDFIVFLWFLPHVLPQNKLQADFCFVQQNRVFL